jgi:hypothetical protein
MPLFPNLKILQVSLSQVYYRLQRHHYTMNLAVLQHPSDTGMNITSMNDYYEYEDCLLDESESQNPNGEPCLESVQITGLELLFDSSASSEGDEFSYDSYAKDSVALLQCNRKLEQTVQRPTQKTKEYGQRFKATRRASNESYSNDSVDCERARYNKKKEPRRGRKNDSDNVAPASRPPLVRNLSKESFDSGFNFSNEIQENLAKKVGMNRAA